MAESDKTLYCRYCGKCTENKIVLERHISIAHKHESNIFQQDEPQRKKPRLDQHVKTLKAENKAIISPGSSQMLSSDTGIKLKARSKEKKKETVKENEKTKERKIQSKKGRKLTTAMQSDHKITDLEKKLENLKTALKDKFCLYLYNLRLVSLGNLRHDKFDKEVRNYFSSETIRTHEEFFYEFLKTVRSVSPLCLLSEDNCTCSTCCNNLSEASTSKIRSNCHADFSDDGNLTGNDSDACLDLMSYVDGHSIRGKSRPSCDLHALYSTIQNESSVGLCLPDLETAFALMLIHAWENNLNFVDVTAVPILRQSVELYIRRIIMAVLINKNKFKLKDGIFVYNMAQENRPHSKSTTKRDHSTPFSHHCTVNIEDIIDVLKVPSAVTPLENLRSLALESAITKFSPSDCPVNLHDEKSNIKTS